MKCMVKLFTILDGGKGFRSYLKVPEKDQTIIVIKQRKKRGDSSEFQSLFHY